MGLVYLPTLGWFYGFHVGKYTVRPMDPLGYGKPLAENMDHQLKMFFRSGCTMFPGFSGLDFEQPDRFGGVGGWNMGSFSG